VYCTTVQIYADKDQPNWYCFLFGVNNSRFFKNFLFLFIFYFHYYKEKIKIKQQQDFILKKKDLKNYFIIFKKKC